jgi:hypothetical protein
VSDRKTVFTILLQDEVRSLEVLTSDGVWIPANPIPGELYQQYLAIGLIPTQVISLSMWAIPLACGRTIYSCRLFIEPTTSKVKLGSVYHFSSVRTVMLWLKRSRLASRRRGLPSSNPSRLGITTVHEFTCSTLRVRRLHQLSHQQSRFESRGQKRFGRIEIVTCASKRKAKFTFKKTIWFLDIMEIK